MVHYVMSK